MGDLFNTLCKGPVIVIDDEIGKKSDIDKLIAEIEDANLAVIKFNNLEEARKRIQNILFSNFIIVDWRLIDGSQEIPMEVTTGAEREIEAEQDVLEFIKDMQKVCLAPIFIVSAYDKGEIETALDKAGVSGKGDCVFIENKSNLCGTPGTLMNKIENWIESSPHVYITKYWMNEWLTTSALVFWDLFKLDSEWPAIFYRSFEEDGDDPALALKDTLFQLIFSQIGTSGMDLKLLKDAAATIDPSIHKDSLRNLHKRLVCIEKDIDKDIRPGDVFKGDVEGTYFLNIRPECDTTTRVDDNPSIYLIKGQAKQYDDESLKREEPYGLIPKENQIFVYYLQDHDVVVFDKRKLSIKPYNIMKNKKICRISSPTITQIRQSYSSYLGRFGIPKYPKVWDGFSSNSSALDESHVSNHCSINNLFRRFSRFWKHGPRR